MRIAAVETHVCHAYRTNWVFVVVRTDVDGLYGLGEATLEYKEQAVVGAVRDLQRFLVGRDPRRIESIWHTCHRDGYWRGGPVLMTALSGVEMALWDILGKHLNVPVHQLLGGKVRDRVACYANGWFAPAVTADEFAEKAARAVEQGFAALKWDPFSRACRDLSTQELAAAMEVVSGVKEAVAGRADLLIEAHGRFDVPSAIRAGRALEPFDVRWLEEPVPPDSLEALAEVKRAVRVPIAAGERLYSRWEYRRFLELACAHYAQPDVSHVGGIGELRRIAAMAEACHVALCPHNPSGPVANAAALQVAAATPSFHVLETMAVDVPWRGEVAGERLELDGGQLLIGDAPGLGVELNLKAVAEHPYQPTDLRHYRGDLTDIRPPDAVPYFEVRRSGPS